MTQEFVVTDPSGREFVVTAPPGASQEQILSYAKSQFSSTPGGAAVGNPNLQRQGDIGSRLDQRIFNGAQEIGASGLFGAGFGAISGDILQGLGRFAGGIPATRVLAPALENAGRLLKTQRGSAATSGAVSGLAGESAGQVAEASGADPFTAEAFRFAGGAATPELYHAGKLVLERYVATPALSLMSKIRKESAKELLAKIQGRPATLSDQERAYLDTLLNELREGPNPAKPPIGRTDAPLEAVGREMGDVASQGQAKAGDTLAAAGMMFDAAGAPAPVASREFADIGGDLRGAIVKRNEAAIEARKAQYAKNEEARDAIVSQREKAGQFVNMLPNYQALVSSLREQLKPGVRSASVQAGIKKVLADLESFATTPGSRALSDQGDFLVSSPPKQGPMSFQALDDVRRKLGDAFRGKPSEGYDAIGDVMAKDLYGKISEIQKRYAGAPQSALLDDYAARTEGLQQFRSKAGLKATALDRYDDSQFSTDASALPKTYFKTRASVQALKELTGDVGKVNRSAMEFANKELAGKTGPEVRAWLGKNSEMLGELPVVRKMVDDFAGKLETAERSARNAADFAKRAEADANLLLRDKLPAQRAVDLIRSGSDELWTKVGPAIAKSPEAKQQMISAVRQVMADQARSESAANFFNRNVRGFLERSGIASADEMNFIADKLEKIRELKVPEPEKLGMVRRVILQGTGGWAATAAGRGSVWSKDKIVPE